MNANRGQGRAVGQPMVMVKGRENQPEGLNIDANSMALIESQKMKENELIKKEKIQNFMNSTRINASKLYKQKVEQSHQQLQSKKGRLEKQKEIKAKYTILPNKNETGEKIKVLPKQPSQVNWKQAQNAMRIVQIPQDKVDSESSDNQSFCSSDGHQDRSASPGRVIEQNKQIREHMLKKLKR